MKKILVLLSLIYFISCVTEYCDEIENVQTADDCLTSNVKNETDNCCYIEVKVGDQNGYGCGEYHKSLTVDYIFNYLKSYFENQGKTLVSVKCPNDQGTNPTPSPSPSPSNGSYLRTGLLLLAAFLL